MSFATKTLSMKQPVSFSNRNYFKIVRSTPKIGCIMKNIQVCEEKTFTYNVVAY